MKRDKNVQDAVQKEVFSAITTTKKPPKAKKTTPKKKGTSPTPKPKLNKEDLVTEITSSIMAKMPQILKDAGYVKKDEAVPKYIVNSLEFIAQSDYARLKKWPAMFSHLETIIEFFNLKIKK